MVVVVMDKHSSRTEHSDREHGGANANQWQIDRSSEAESPWSLVHSEPFIVAVDASNRLLMICELKTGQGNNLA